MLERFATSALTRCFREDVAFAETTDVSALYAGKKHLHDYRLLVSAHLCELLHFAITVEVDVQGEASVFQVLGTKCAG